MKEVEIQKLVQALLSEPSRVWKTQSGKRLQVLSPGQINHLEGPDYLDIGILLNGFIVVGNAEFHRNASDWHNHNHSQDSRYDSVILHIVFNENAAISKSFETLVLDEKEVYQTNTSSKSNPDIPRSAEDLQHFALVRLLRKASIAQRYLNQYSLVESLRLFADEFARNYESKRRRPIYNSLNLEEITSALISSKNKQFLESINHEDNALIPDRMLELLKSKIASEGAAFRRELILNTVLPLALCLADEQARINLFLWFWSTPALNKYGVLRRYFPDFSQNFLWQQQGMLEYLREHGNKQNIVSEAIANYGFGEILNFYRVGRSPFLENEA